MRTSSPQGVSPGSAHETGEAAKNSSAGTKENAGVKASAGGGLSGGGGGGGVVVVVVEERECVVWVCEGTRETRPPHGTTATLRRAQSDTLQPQPAEHAPLAATHAH